jgi:hypothetical protein
MVTQVSDTVSGHSWQEPFSYDQDFQRGGIFVVGTDSVDAGASATEVTLTEPVGSAEGDLIIAIVKNDATLSDWTHPSDFTTLQEDTSTGNQRIFLGYKVRGADEGEGYTFTHDFVSGTHTAGLLVSLRGVDATTPFDVTYSEPSHHAESTDDLSYAPSAITTVTDQAMVVILSAYSGGPGTIAWSGITGYVDREVLAGGSGRNLNCLTKTVMTAGTETPGSFGTTGDAGEDGASFTLAVRPSTTTGHLDFRVKGGVTTDNGSNISQVSDTSVTLADDAVNNIGLEFDVGVIGLEENLGNNIMRLYEVTTVGGEFNAIVDVRAPFGSKAVVPTTPAGLILDPWLKASLDELPIVNIYHGNGLSDPSTRKVLDSISNGDARIIGDTSQVTLIDGPPGTYSMKALRFASYSSDTNASALKMDWQWWENMASLIDDFGFFNFWFRVGNLSQDNYILASGSYNSTDNDSYIRVETDGTFRWNWKWNSTIQVLETNASAISANTWHQVTVGIPTNGGNATIYVDGVEDINAGTATNRTLWMKDAFFFLGQEWFEMAPAWWAQSSSTGRGTLTAGLRTNAVDRATTIDIGAIQIFTENAPSAADFLNLYDLAMGN